MIHFPRSSSIFLEEQGRVSVFYFILFPLLPLPYIIVAAGNEDPGDPSWRNGATQGVNPGWSTAQVLITLAANAMRRVLITAVVNSRLIYHRYTRYLCVCVYARIPREELEGRCVHYVTRRYHLAHIYIAMILARVTRAGVTAAEPPSPGLSPASSPNFLRVSDLTRHGSFARFHRILTSFFIRRIRTKVSFKCTRMMELSEELN